VFVEDLLVSSIPSGYDGLGSLFFGFGVDGDLSDVELVLFRSGYVHMSG
jgi:hypothetical protein